MTTFSWQRAVIKVGSTLIAPDGNRCSGRFLLSLARFITASREQGKEVILVSSGSVAAGRGEIKVHHRPSIAEKQAHRLNKPVQPNALRLFNLRKQMNLPNYKAHNALEDAISTAELFLAQKANINQDLSKIRLSELGFSKC